ncbi:MAG TPA: hypothetical protein VKU00_31820 [Chthonomonadaceae bacterium]|nr:hypothetical protein [Chthonomonadaceae bacterium]
MGKVCMGLPEEGWPEYEGVPMLPLCQLRCEGMPALPTALQGVALLCVFTASVGEEMLSPQGGRWMIRTYESLEGLVPLTYPGDVTSICSYPIDWHGWLEYPPNRAYVPEALWIDYGARNVIHRNSNSCLVDETPISKVGGYWESPDPDAPLQDSLWSDFVFQIYVEGEFPWLRSSGGVVYFLHAADKEAQSWRVLWKPDRPEFNPGGKTVSLGCEVEGMRLFISDTYARTLTMSYQEHIGPIYRLGDLHGLVHITTGEMALRFVRLRTSGWFPHEWRCTRLPSESEVFTPLEYAALPDWCRSGRRGVDLKKRFEQDAQTTLQFGMEPAKVEVTENGLRITRWTHSYLYDLSRRTYQKIMETVTQEGGYMRVVLEQHIAPDSELLRPAGNPGETDPDELLRPSA